MPSLLPCLGREHCFANRAPRSLHLPPRKGAPRIPTPPRVFFCHAACHAFFLARFRSECPFKSSAINLGMLAMRMQSPELPAMKPRTPLNAPPNKPASTLRSKHPAWMRCVAAPASSHPRPLSSERALARVVALPSLPPPPLLLLLLLLPLPAVHQRPPPLRMPPPPMPASALAPQRRWVPPPPGITMLPGLAPRYATCACPPRAMRAA